MATYRAECSDKLRRASQYGLCCNEKNISLEFPSVLSGPDLTFHALAWTSSKCRRKHDQTISNMHHLE